MADKEDKNQQDAPEIDKANARVEITEADKKKARRFFERAKELAAGKSWDFAIKCYHEGLGFWPEAVEEGHQPLRLAACERNVRGGKKPGFADGVKFSMTSRDAKKAMLNAEWLLSLDPFNVSYMEGLFKAANKLHAEETLMWIGPIFGNAAENEKKISPKRFSLMRDVYEEAGDRAVARGEVGLSVQCYERAAEALQLQSRVDPKDRSLTNELRDLSTKLTILKGKYESGGDYKESMRDSDQQKLLHDQDRMVQTDEELEKLITAAKQAVDANPGNLGKVEALADLLCRREDESGEKQAIDVLMRNFKEHNDYQFRMKAEDIRIKQLRRSVREANAAGNKDQALELYKDQLRFELKVFAERIKQYPTDNRFKYEYAQRLFSARKYDEAIPFFQAGRTDPKVRTLCDLKLGQCFFQKKFFPQAIGTLTKAVANYEFAEDNTGKELRYWLARSQEAAGNADAARDVYGQVLEMDYNFRDVRDRLAALN